ncbi:hypothetical protein [Streptomyces purpureus]|uniref:Uncharacterized protein n=1 Tax=Streptomyces purpureus TaxID=1951 RepID=A0A918H7J6_9ACTN|nr:hypothetical protein [Streptomyces purpureus]GGT39257.1 hypothetical protein GCM10014713_36160 [Streptomyces purpureus]
MGSEGRGTVRGPQSEPVCPACGQPVGTVIKRHKSLGAWVPVWEPQPCHNPDCKLFGHKPHGAATEQPGGDRPEEAEVRPEEPGGQDETGKDVETGRSQAPG